MLPKLKSLNYPGMELIRPLYLVKEHDILRWQNYTGLRFLSCACALEQRHAETGEAGKRQRVKELIAALRKENGNVDSNLFHSVENVNLETLLGYHIGEKRTTFLESYDSIRNEHE
jgi:tRNA(Ile)-lysidine synthase TilS/MesJ